MNSLRDEAKRLRIRDSTVVDALSQMGRDPSLGKPCIVAQTKTIATYPVEAQGFFACSPLTILGPEMEGGAGIATTGPSTFYALNVGTAVPPIGANILATFVDSRWVFRYDG